MTDRLWLPPSGRTYRAPKVSREHWEGMLAWEAQVERCMEWTGGILDHWTPELQNIDPLLCLAQAKVSARVEGVIPGLYHLIRRRDPSQPSFMMVAPLMGPDGQFVEPTDAMLRALRAADLQNPRAVADRLERDRLAERDRQTNDRNDDADRRAEVSQRLDAIIRTQVNMSDDIPWAQNHAGSRRPTKGKRR
jgi:hypothetical protein